MNTIISIGIQARSSSNRLPNKVTQMIGNKPMICHVLNAARSTSIYLNKFRSSGPYSCSVSLLVPMGDPVVRVVGVYYPDIHVIEGDEHDVLSRYKSLLEADAANYVVRITGDCPLIPPYLISKAVIESSNRGFDYLSNAYPEMRLSPDGWDCEVISARLLDWACENATAPEDREHVTTLIKRSPPGWANMGIIHGFLDMSELKYSVDSKEDLERVRAQFEKIHKTEIEFKAKYHGEVVRF